MRAKGHLVNRFCVTEYPDDYNRSRGRIHRPWRPQQARFLTLELRWKTGAGHLRLTSRSTRTQPWVAAIMF